MSFPRIAKLNTPKAFQQRLSELELPMGFDQNLETGDRAPLAQTCHWNGRRIGNRFCILPMEGWDGTTTGLPSDLTIRRWIRFGQSGAKLIWGGEAVAVRPDGRANPNQLLINDSNLSALAHLRATLFQAHEQQFGGSEDLVAGLQLTHSGRFARPNADRQLHPLTVYDHPVLDRHHEDSSAIRILSDIQIHELIQDFIRAGRLAWEAGFDFVDIKHCHGYFGHELLSAYDRPGEFGGSFENRTRFITEIAAGLRDAAPHLGIGVRLSIFDFVPFEPGPDRVGVPSRTGNYRNAFGGDASGLSIDLDEPRRFLDLLSMLDIQLVCTTAGSPYYSYHLQRPAAFPACDGYLPPEDPLVGVNRQIQATADLNRDDMILVGSGYSYLQEWLPHVAQHNVRQGKVDFIGLGRMALSYPELPSDVMAGRPLQRKKICRTFSDCTTAPRNGLISGCFPLDPHYKSMPVAQELKLRKKRGHDQA